MGLIKIHNRYLDNVTWTNAEACNFALINNDIDIWRINISDNLPLLTSFLSIIQPGEIARANKYFHIKDKNRFVISRGALRYILGKYLNRTPNSIEFGIGENKKPHIINSDLHYNISHSGDWILCAISNSEIGADTELINHDFKYRDVIEDNFSSDEVNYIRQNLSVERFFMLWTRKEALTKATGKGLDEDLKLIPCLDGVHPAQSDVIASVCDWLISSFKLHEQYIASVASNTLLNEIRFWDIDFKKSAIFF